jgi:hypothetical protein
MASLAPDWEIVGREAHSRLRHLLNFLQILLVIPVAAASHASMTFKVRHRTTGEIRNVIANSVEEAAILIAQGQFDKE